MWVLLSRDFNLEPYQGGIHPSMDSTCKWWTSSRIIIFGISKFFVKSDPANVALLWGILIIHTSSSCKDNFRILISFVLLMLLKAEGISTPVILISTWNFWTSTKRKLWYHTVSDVLQPVNERNCCEIKKFKWSVV